MADNDASARGPTSGAGPIAFHGIVSRGLLQALSSRADGPSVWRENAHRLDQLSRSDPELGWLAEAADACGVLSHRQSWWAANAYLRTQFNLQAGASVHARQIKEGHTSSVWLVQISAGGTPCESFVLNVARDRAANAELAETTEALAKLALDRTTLSVAAVHEITEITIPAVDRDTGDMDPRKPWLPVVVARVELIPDALEIHSCPRPERFILVEEFITDPECPATIKSVRGRLVAAAEAAVIDGTVTAAAAAATPYRVEVDEGDLVWSHDRAVVVALS
jgi:hypothetical protein